MEKQAKDNKKIWADWGRFVPGRQGTGYEKMLLMLWPWPKSDLYLLRFREGIGIPPHADPVPGWKHYRVNWVIWKAHAGGEFVCDNPILSIKDRLYLFRSDLCVHEVKPVTRGTRMVLSFGFLRKDRPEDYV